MRWLVTAHRDTTDRSCVVVPLNAAEPVRNDHCMGQPLSRTDSLLVPNSSRTLLSASTRRPPLYKDVTVPQWAVIERPQIHAKGSGNLV